MIGDQPHQLGFADTGDGRERNDILAAGEAGESILCLIDVPGHLARRELVRLGERHEEGDTIIVKPSDHHHVEFGRFVAGIHQLHDQRELLTALQVLFDELAPAGPDLFRDFGIAIAWEIDEVESLVDEIVVQLARLSRLGAGAGKGFAAAELVDQRRFASCLSAATPRTNSAEVILMDTRTGDSRSTGLIVPGLPCWFILCLWLAFRLFFLLRGRFAGTRGAGDFLLRGSRRLLGSLLTGVEIDQLDHGNLRAVAVTLAKTDDACIPARPRANLLDDRRKKLADNGAVFDQLPDLTSRMDADGGSVFLRDGVLCTGDDLLHDHAGLFCLCDGRGDPLVAEQRRRESCQRRPAMACGAFEFSA
jgi:hypothetical protein